MTSIFCRLAALLQVLLVLAVCAAAPAQSAGRRALVIGTANYQHLRDPTFHISRVERIGRALRQRGFDVIESYNEGNAHIRGKLGRFATSISPDDFAMIVLVGHVVAIRDTFVYVSKDSDAKFERVRFTGISAVDFTAQLNRARKGLLLVLSSNPDLPAQPTSRRPVSQSFDFKSDKIALFFTSSTLVPISRLDYFAQRGVERLADVIGEGASDGRAFGRALLGDRNGSSFGYAGALPLSAPASWDGRNPAVRSGPGQAALAAGLRAMRLRNSLLQQRLALLTTRLRAANERIAALRKQLEQRNLFRTPPEKDSKEVERLNRVIAGQMRAIKALTTEGQQLRARISTLDDRLRGATQERDAARQKSGQAQEEWRRNTAAVEAELDRAKKAAGEFEARLAAEREKSAALEASLTRQSKELESLRSDGAASGEQYDARIKELQRENAAFAAKSNEFAELQGKLDAEIARLKKMNAYAERRLQQEQKKAAGLSAQLDRKTKALAELEKRVTADRQTTAQSKRQTEALGARVVKLEKELQSARAEMAREMAARHRSEKLAFEASRSLDRSEERALTAEREVRQMSQKLDEDLRVYRQREQLCRQRLADVQFRCGSARN